MVYPVFMPVTHYLWYKTVILPRVFPGNWHRYIFLFGLISLGAGMLFGTVPTSIPEFILFGNWLLEGRFREKWQLLKSNRIFWVLSAMFLLHLAGMTYTDNVQQGLNDLRNKIPLQLIPLVLFSTKPISPKEFRALFGFFLLSVFVSSICCYLVYLGFTKKVISDPRQASIFMSHIRFSLFIAFAMACCAYFFLKESRPVKLILALLFTWLLWYLYRLEMATGFICLCVLGFAGLAAYAYFKFSRWLGFGIVLLGLGAALWAGRQFRRDCSLFYKAEHAEANILKKHTFSGNPYLQDTLFGLAENGNLITVNISDEELRREWARRSTMPYDGTDQKKNNLRFTVLRYLASKGLTKDSAGLSLLSATDIHNIEMGVTNYRYPVAAGLKARWRELVWEYTKYRRGENPSGHTFTMRLEFWRTALYLIRHHPLTGVGTGDVQDAFNKAYTDTQSKLDTAWRLRNHNQYLAMAVAFGIPGLLLFLICLCYPAWRLRKQLHLLYWPFFLISLLSFLTEDTLETQSGVTFFAFYNTLFLWLACYRQPDSPKAR